MAHFLKAPNEGKIYSQRFLLGEGKRLVFVSSESGGSIISSIAAKNEGLEIHIQNNSQDSVWNTHMFVSNTNGTFDLEGIENF